MNVCKVDTPKTIIHIGPPKTGTTTVQEKVLANLSSICFLGKPWWNPDVPYDKCVGLHRAIDSVTKADLSSYDEVAAKQALADWLAHAPNAQRQPDGTFLPRVLSEERLCFTDNVGFDEIARRLAVLFPSAEIVYVKRDPVSGLRSFYRWLYARAWVDSSFSGWLEKMISQPTNDWQDVAIRCFDWHLIENAYGAHFSTVRSAEFAQLHQDSSQFLQHLFRLNPAELAELQGEADQPLNVSQNRAISELHRAAKKSIRLWNKLPFHKIDEKPEYLGDTPMWKTLEAPLRGISWGNKKLSISQADKEKIIRYYAPRNSVQPANHAGKADRPATQPDR
ncbi:sulfotransferase [Aliiroseovarius sediminis]|uniref:sulfotransferase n=1 Tax=Aliiroseovarius sediminis TaxID=2925839 RepID=UPI001F56F379|nr:sulfotransferase [Aliiroseovarius sediminis]MCI2395755.1 sulfotransferase [Aliiroseovarius sediminis]